jgi:hypothetical protein
LQGEVRHRRRVSRAEALRWRTCKGRRGAAGLQFRPIWRRGLQVVAAFLPLALLKGSPRQRDVEFPAVPRCMEFPAVPRCKEYPAVPRCKARQAAAWCLRPRERQDGGHHQGLPRQQDLGYLAEGRWQRRERPEARWVRWGRAW